MKLQLIGVLSSLLLATPSLASYLPSFDIDGQINSSKSGYEQRALSLISTTPFVENRKKDIFFSDIRLSNSNVKGLHIGFGARRKIKHVMLGFNGFYDIYDTKNDYRQFVTGLEVLNPTVEMRATLYQPNKTEFITYKNYEGEFLVKLKGVFVGLNTYRMVDHGDKYDGSGIKLKYENKGEKRWSLYFSAGYQYDELYEHQFSTNFGIKITAGNVSRNNHIPHIERDMKLYRTAIDDRFLFSSSPFGGLFGNANILLADQGNYRELFKNSEKGDVIVIDRDLEVSDTIKLKEGQKLYGRSYLNGKKDKLEKVSFADGSGSHATLISLNNNTTVAGLELDSKNMQYKKYAGMIEINDHVNVVFKNCKVNFNIPRASYVLRIVDSPKDIIIDDNTFYVNSESQLMLYNGTNGMFRNNTAYLVGRSKFLTVSGHIDGETIVNGNNIIFNTTDSVYGIYFTSSGTLELCKPGVTCTNNITIDKSLTKQQIQNSICNSSGKTINGKVEFIVNGDTANPYYCPGP